MINLDKTIQQKIHTRKIDTVIYEGESDTIIVEGSLQDKRFCNSYMFSGEIRPPYTVHHMIIRLELQLPDLTILEIELERPSVPHEFCCDIRECLEPLKLICFCLALQYQAVDPGTCLSYGLTKVGLGSYYQSIWDSAMHAQLKYVGCQYLLITLHWDIVTFC